MGKIEWTDVTWNPIVGCSLVSPGCTNCYAMRMAARMEAMGVDHYGGVTKKINGKAVWTGRINLAPDSILTAPLRWRKPRRVFVNSMSDLFHENVPDEAIDRVFVVMALCPQHTFQVLTKRPERMREYLTKPSRTEDWANASYNIVDDDPFHPYEWDELPLPNVWLGTSAEDQPRAYERIPHLLATPAAVRFVSYEPALGPIDFTPWLFEEVGGHDAEYVTQDMAIDGGFPEMAGELYREAEPPQLVPTGAIDLIIYGNESGPGRRPGNLDWGRATLAQCRAAGVAFFGKQDDKVRDLPPDLQVREWPGGSTCEDCPPVGYTTDKTRCEACPRRSPSLTNGGDDGSA